MIRSTTAMWEYVDEETGKIEKAKITVEYKGRSIADLRAFENEVKGRDENSMVYISETLAQRIHRLPDILGDGKVTVEFLEDQDIRNLNALNEAIAENENPKK